MSERAAISPHDPEADVGSPSLKVPSQPQNSWLVLERGSRRPSCEGLNRREQYFVKMAVVYFAFSLLTDFAWLKAERSGVAGHEAITRFSSRVHFWR